ncbi:hypothetical protein [Bradyrhizobium erythrophlei]|uniref:Uncharacterized protein n=1 Tax=Bradyrhizobium erythrophlei TaxID=1437360 RepID=A0A1M5H380_9BRAD|nr:hypothetical protein [Bradyrhizobium erythrophlei]SHG10394.1 hypothetical protein SAMN05443248_0297 [Bradyrhizobium erythrophlei]
MSLSIFDQYGHVSRAINPADVEALPDDQRAILMTTLTACRDAEDCEAKISELRIAVNKSMHAYDRAVLAHDAAQPKVTHQAALLATLAANDPDHYPAPKKPRPINPKIKTALVTALQELTTVRDALQNATAEFKTLSRARGEAIGRWMKCQAPITPESVTRAYIARGDAERVGIANGTIIPPPEPKPGHVWPIEAARAVKAKRAPQYFGNATVKR